MESLISFGIQWFQNNQALVWLATAASAVVFLGFIVGVPVVMVKLPADYFQRPRSRWRKGDGWSASRLVYLILKNILGVILVVAGMAMLFLPGQGLFTMIIGVSMLNVPGKRRLVRRIIGERHVLGPLNRLRARFSKPPFEIAPRRKRFRRQSRESGQS